MGFFDFLHGGVIRSEAEVYMEKRNKEYARKAAEYRRKEYSFNVADKLSQYLSFEKYSHTNRQITRPSTQRSASSQWHDNMYTHNKDANRSSASCDTCAPEQEPYDASVINVIAASANTSTRTVTISCTIERGRFMNGDRVTVHSNGRSFDTTIISIIRQGNKIDYANSASGKIAIVLSNIVDVISSGAKITKED